MRPVVCANCGMKNPRGSKYCNECGHELTPASTQLCPNCDASNPIDRLYCDNCGARLAAEEEPPRQEKEPPDEAADTGRSEPFSLPERPPGQTGRLELDRELPAWLRTGEEENEGTADDPEAESGAPEGAAPEEEGEHRPTDDLPDWLLEEDEASDIFRSEKTTDELFLASQEEADGGDGGDGGDEENGEEEEAPEEAGLTAASPEKGKAEKALNDWLAGEALDDEEETSDAGLADWLEALEQEEDAAPAEEGLSDWLAELEDGDEEDGDEEDGDESEGEKKADESVGAWLADLEADEGQPPEQQPEEEEEGEGMADWLADLEGEEEAASDPEKATGKGLTNWLADLEGEEEAAGRPEKATDKGMTEWLAGLEGEEEAADRPEKATGKGMTEWLAGLEGEEKGAEAGGDQETATGKGMTEWLADLESEGAPGFDAAEADTEGAAGEEVLPWEMEAADEEASAAEQPDVEQPEGEEWDEADEGVPDWLADLEEEAAAEAGEPLDFEEEELAPAKAEEDWLPWEMEADGGEEPAPEEPSPVESAAPAPEAEQPDVEEPAEQAPEVERPEAEGWDEADDGVPDWLADLEEEAAAEAEAVEGEEEDEPLPWEHDEAAGAGAEADVPDWLAGMEEEAGAVEEAPSEGAFSEEAASDWLAGLHGEEVQEEEEEETAGAAEEEAPETGAPETGDAEIPAWLADLDSAAIQSARAEEEGRGEAAPEEAAPEEAAPEEAAPEMAEEEAPEIAEGADAFLEESGQAEEASEAEAEEAPDWLASFDAEEEGEWATPEMAGDESPAEEEVPDWLAEIDEAAGDAGPTDAAAIEMGAEEEAGATIEEEEEEEALPADEIPDWLQDMAPEAGEEDGEEADEELTAILGAMDAGDDMPDWLLEEDATAPPEEAEAPEAPLQEDDVFAAFEDATPEEATTAPEEAAPEVEEEGLFDWSDVDAPPEEGEAPAEIDFTAAAEEALDLGEPFDLPVEMEDSDQVPAEDLPDWLGDVMADVDAEAPAGEEADIPAAAEKPEPASDMENVPEQLAGAALPEWLEDSLPEEAAPAEPTPLDEMPDWIQAAGQSFLSEAEEETPTTGVEDEEEMAEFDLGLETSGEWEDLLEGLPPPEPTAEEVREAEIPEWVQALKPQELTGEEPETREPQTPAETSGPLAGLPGVIGVEPAVTEPRSTSPMTPLAPSKEQEQQATLLRQLTRGEASEAVVVAPTAETAASPWVRALLALLLLATVLVGLFVPGLLEITPQTTGVAQAQEAIAAAGGRPVLVAFDYTPATAADLDDQARLLLEALAEGDSPVLFISQSPAGLALAQQAVEQVDGLESQRLGYLPGEAIGLRRLASCLETGSACRPIAGLGEQEAAEISAADLGLIVVFAADRDSLINWIEQVDAATNVPMVAGVTQALAPVAGPYVTSDQLDGLLAGFPATAALQAESGEMSNRTQAEMEMLTLAQWLVVVLFVVGNLLYLAFGARRSQKAAQKAAQKAEGEDA